MFLRLCVCVCELVCAMSVFGLACVCMSLPVCAEATRCERGLLRV